MKTFTAVFAAAVVGMTASIALARDLGPDEALRLRDAGTIQSFEKLNTAALAKHPGATIKETELKEKNGRYIYKVELRDLRAGEWDLAFDAASGQLLKNHQDR